MFAWCKCEFVQDKTLTCDSSFRKHCKFHQIHAQEIDLYNVVAMQITGHLADVCLV